MTIQYNNKMLILIILVLLICWTPIVTSQNGSTLFPSEFPSQAPSIIPTVWPTLKPSVQTTIMPTRISSSPTQAPNNCPTFPTSQLNPLKDLYNSAGGPNWRYTDGNRQPWDFSVPKPNPCADQWQYLRCLNCFILQLTFTAGTNMTGSLPDSIGQLKYLTVSPISVCRYDII